MQGTICSDLSSFRAIHRFGKVKGSYFVFEVTLVAYFFLSFFLVSVGKAVYLRLKGARIMIP